MIKKRITPSPEKSAFDARRAVIAQHYAAFSNADIGKMLGITAHHVGQVAMRMGVRKLPRVKAAPAPKDSKSPWNEKNLQTLEALYATTKTPELAGLLGMTESAVYQEAAKRGLSKDKELWAQWISETKRAARLEKQTARPKAEQQLRIKGPPPMTPAQAAQREKERFSYADDELPWRAQVMRGPAWMPPPMTYRGQQQRSSS